MNNTLNVLNHKSLSIQLSSDGFSFCVFNKTQQVYEDFVEINFERPSSAPNDLYKNVKEIFNENELLHANYQDVTLIHHNNINTFVPTEFFDKSLLFQYLEQTVKVFNSDLVCYDNLIEQDVKNVFVPFNNINQFISDSFSDFSFCHATTVFFKNILSKINVSQKEMFVNVYNNNFDILVLENNQLVLSNAFEFTNSEDFVYYILFTAEQLKMDPNVFKLTLFGKIDTFSNFYKLLYQYVRNVEFFKSKNNKLSSNIKVETHQYFNLLNMY